jgi:ADP-heptose:LPS heptosyltransferase
MELFLRFSSILSYLSGARKRAGFYGFSFKMPYRGDLHTHKVNYNHHMHISNNFLALIQSLSVASKDPFLKEALMARELILPTIKSDKNDECDILSKLKAHNQEMSRTSKIIILHPGVGDAMPLRRWPLERYLELIRRLSDDPSIFFVIVGVKSKSPNIKITEQLAAHPRVINFIGKTTVRELVGLFNISYLLLSHDSGMVHLASLANINIVALFGPESPLLYRPLDEKCIVIYKNFICSPCVSAYNYKNSPCRMNKCMQAISIEEVFQEIKKVMQ